MNYPSTVFLGFTLLLLSLVCLGTWPAFLRLSSTPNAPIVFGYSFRYRDTRFAFLDYALSYVVSSSIPLTIALAREENTSSGSPTPLTLIVFALVGGCLLSLGNMSMQWATTIFGAPLTTVVAIQASLTVLLGTSINYCLQPEMTERPDLLLAGVFVFLAAIGLATRAHLLYGEEQDLKSPDGIELGPSKLRSYGSLESNDSLESTSSMENGIRTTALVVDNLSRVKSDTHSPRLALIVSVFGGCCFGFFSPAFNVAVNDPFGFSGGTPLSVPLANLWFSVAFAVASFAGNVPLMYHPPSQFGMLETTVSEYCRETLSERKLAIFAGLLCGSANLLQFQGGSLVGFATADLVQAFPLISTLWDIFLFGEFRSAGGTVIFYILAMYSMYICGITFLISSAAA
jgi:hypothetical protein